MRFLSSSADLEAEFRRLLAAYRHFDCAVAWAGVGHEPFNQLRRLRGKIRRLVVGIHFQQTSPHFIRAFLNDVRVRYRLDAEGASGVFHPKIYLFSDGNDKWEAIVGSANFTAGAFGRNVEHAVLFGSGDSQEGISYGELRNEIKALWNGGRRFRRGELEAYEWRWKRNQQRLKRAAGHPTARRPGESVIGNRLLNLSWSQYLQELRQRRERYFDDRLKVIRETRAIWTDEPKFSRLTHQERKQIAGIASEKIVRWRLFGSMRGALKFVSVLKARNRFLLRALDWIPLSGTVTKEHYERFITDLEFAFDQKKEFGGLAVATRLLCMRRPDYFVCIDNKNRSGLCTMLGVLPEKVTVESYWDAVVSPIVEAPWWQSTRPPSDRKTQTIWDARVAMLDAMFYEGHG